MSIKGIKIPVLAGLILAEILFAGTAFSQNCAEFDKLIADTYNFKPSKLTGEERNAKSVKMDAVWNKVEADPRNLLPCLRAVIASRTSDPFFRFDASNLLFRLDQGAETKKTMIKAYSEVDLTDVNLRYWIPYIALFGYEGFDTSAAGDAWLRHPDPYYYLPPHGTRKVNKYIGSYIIYGSMDESIATPALAKIASNEGHPERVAAIVLLYEQATPAAFRELQKINRKGITELFGAGIDQLLAKPDLLAKREGTPKNSREQVLDAFRKLIDHKPEAFIALTSVPDGERDLLAVMKEEDIPIIRKARRVMMLAANPHSADWYKRFTKVLMAMVWKPELVKPEP